MECLAQVSIWFQGFRAECLPDLLGDFFQFFHCLRLTCQRPAVQLFGDSSGQVLGDESLDHTSLVIHDSVDTKVQVRAIELEKFPEEIFEFFIAHNSCPIEINKKANAYLTQLVQDQITRPMMMLGILAFSMAMDGYSELSDTSTQWFSVWDTRRSPLLHPILPR